MNVSDIKEEIESLVNKQIMIKVSGSRSRNQMLKGVVNQVYPNIFTVIVIVLCLMPYSNDSMSLSNYLAGPLISKALSTLFISIL